jgi:antitoxin MazE
MGKRRKKCGDASVVCIPAALLAEAGLYIDDPVTVRAERGRIIIERSGSTTYQLDDLLAKIRPENLHAFVDAGAVTGREVW